MHSLVAAALALLCSPLALPAQQFQFMQARPRALVSLLPRVETYVGYAAVDDLDGDGHPDVLASFMNDFGVFWGSATGPLGATTVLPWGGQRPVLVDLDGDGDRDLAFVPPQPLRRSTVALYANTPSGLQPVALPPVMVHVLAEGATLGDVDGDGFADLVIGVSPGTPGQSIVLARGGPGLQFTLDLGATPTGLPQGLWPVLLDADGDGDLDVLASNSTSGLRLLRNHGGSFADATATLPPTRTGQTFLAAADLDGDGHTDCATVVNYRDIEVLWGGPGGFTVGPVVASIHPTQCLLPADFDGDGDVDLLVDAGNGLEVLWTAGNRQFTRTTLAQTRAAMCGTGDVDGDGAHDVVFTLALEPTIVRCVHHARFEDAVFAQRLPPPPAGVALPGAPMAGDVDGDGRTDVVTVGDVVVVDRALGGGVYRQSTSAISFSPTEVRCELADVDGDADLDLVAKTNTELLIATNDGSGTFAQSLRMPSLAVTATTNLRDDLRVADMDADGVADVVVAERRGIVLVRSIGGGQFAQRIVVPLTMVTRLVDVADVDGDGDLDVICDARGSSSYGLTHVIVANDGSGNFTSNPAFRVDLGLAPTSVRAGDLDADGDADLAVVENNALRVYRNHGSGFFQDRTLSDLPTPALGLSSNVVVADLDGDHDLDVATQRPGTNLCLLLNDGRGRLLDRSAAHVEPSVLPGPVVLGAGDLDDDGDTDLMLGGYWGELILTNHVRQCRGSVLPQLGGVAAFELMSGPGFGQTGLAALGFAPALAATPLHVPGMLGKLDLDPATLQILSIVPTSSIGVSTVFASVPQDPVLFGAELWFQGAVLPASDPPGFTNAVYEVVLR